MRRVSSGRLGGRAAAPAEVSAESAGISGRGRGEKKEWKVLSKSIATDGPSQTFVTNDACAEGTCRPQDHPHRDHHTKV